MRRRALLVVFVSSSASAQEYRSPIEPPSSGQQPYVTAYRDLSSGAGVQDWNCGNNAYNGHRGTDIGIGGFPVMDAGSRWAVAAADGDVTFVVDGCFDRCTSGRCDCGAGFGNYVKVTHDDGKSTFYGHLMQNSVQVGVGDRVMCGQRLGKVGSSGNSTGPHLHFEPRYSNNVSDDPFSGACGGPTSFWVGQGAYNALPDTTCAGEMPPEPTTTVKGVVWDTSVTPTPSAPGNVRIPGAQITIDARTSSVAARAVDAYWELALEPGTYRLGFTAMGYEPMTQTVTLAVGETRWASVGLVPESGVPPERTDAILLGGPMLLEVLPSETFEVGFTVQNTGTTTWRESDTELAFDAGYDFGVRGFPLGVGEVVQPGEEKIWSLTVTASTAEGTFHGSWRVQRNGTTFGPLLEMTVLVSTGMDPPEQPPEQPPQMNPDVPMKPEIETKLRMDKISGGCGCSTSLAREGPTDITPLLILLVALRRRSSCSASHP